MYEDVYFKKMHLPNYKEIAAQSLEYIKSVSKVYNRELSSYYILNFDEIKTHCPLLIPSFNELGLEPYLVSIFIMYKNNHGPIHVDLFPPLAKFLIPLLNTEGTTTNFYGNCKVVKVTNPVSGIKSYRPFTSDDMRINASLELDGPAVLRTSVPHNVLMNEACYPRISMQVETKPDCVKFLKPLPDNELTII